MVIDSRKKKLGISDIILLSVEELTAPELRPKMLALIAKESALPSADTVQFGNTVFLTHINKDKSKSIGRAFNVDTARNFIRNGLKFADYIQDKGVKKYITMYDDDVYDSAAKSWKKHFDSQDVETEEGRSKLVIGKAKKHDQTVIFIEFGEEPIL